MTSEYWDQICDLLVEALDQDSEARESFLDARCAGDSKKKEEVLSLIRNHEEAETFLAETPAEGVTRRPAPGLRIGPFEVVRLLGEGGMGAVYLAERVDSSFEHRVAIKLLRAGATHGDLVDRFHRERQILASLDHPHIAKLLDGGSTEDGLPYIVMEYVEGTPIDVYCRRNELAPAERVRLFHKVCDAVQFAHRNLVIHRDLKPGNILVTPEGQPKLLDFGIAKILGSDTLPDLGSPTRTGVMPMTPAYASPEQVSGIPLSTASDVYSLGVLLYELLCEHRPYTFSNDQLLEIIRAICHEEPEPPSVAVLKTSRTEARAGNPSESKARLALARELEGDLDSILMMALRKEPDRRYGSAGQLAEDLERYLDGHPVRARPDTFSYRAGKFVNRNRWPISGIALGVLGLIVAFVWVVLEQRETLRERDRARAAIDLMLDVFEVPAPSRAKGRTITARELLDRGATSTEERFEAQPELLADFRGIIGRTYAGLGLQTEAAERLRGSLALYEEVGKGRSAEAAEVRSHLGRLLSAIGEYEEAESQTQEALRDQHRLFGDRDSRVVETLIHLGDIHRITSRYAEARLHFDEALELSGRLQDPSLAARVRMHYAILETRSGDYERAEELSKNAVHILETAHGPIHPDVAFAYNNLAQSRGELDPGEAETNFRHALSIQNSLHPGDHPSKVATSGNLGGMLLRLGKVEEAERILRQSLGMAARVFGKGHAWYALIQKHLASLERARNNPTEAEALLRSAYEISKIELGEHHPDTASCASDLAQVLEATGRTEEARALYRSALVPLRQKLGDHHPLVPSILNNLSALALREKRFREARDLAIEAITLADTAQGRSHPGLCAFLSNGALAESELDALAAAIEHAERLVERCDASLGFDHSMLLWFRTRIVRWQLELGQLDGCEPAAREVVALWQQASAGSGWHAQSQRLLGTCLMRTGKPGDAEPLLLAGLARSDARYAPDDRRVERALRLLVELYEGMDPEGDSAAPYRARIEAIEAAESAEAR